MPTWLLLTSLSACGSWHSAQVEELAKVSSRAAVCFASTSRWSEKSRYGDQAMAAPTNSPADRTPAVAMMPTVARTAPRRVRGRTESQTRRSRSDILTAWRR